MIWLRWQLGRQHSGYQKMLLFKNHLLLPFDIYLLRFRPRSFINAHTDQYNDGKHYRLNIILKHAKSGGEFICTDTLFSSKHIKLFRPDISEHGVSEIISGTRYVLSIGWIKKRR